MRHAGRRGTAVMVALGLGLTGPMVIGSASARSVSTAPPVTRQIASSTLDRDLRVTLTAIRGPGDGGSPAATVKVAAYERSGSDWKLLGRQTVGDRNGWFWNVVAAPGGMCRFSTSDVNPYPIEVRLLVSASLGCSAVTYNFHVDKYGSLAAG